MSDVDISILKRSAQEVAPEGIWFQASVPDGPVPESLEPGTYDPSFNRYLYLWSFDDAGAASDKVVNLPLVQNDLNRAYGKIAAHVFTRPGRYSVRCDVFGPDGPVGTCTLALEVADPEAHFPDTQTILLDPDGTGDPDSYPDARITPTWEDATEALIQLAGPGRILLRRGLELEVAQHSFTNRTHNVWLGAFGPGDTPPTLRTGSQTQPCLRIDRS